MTFTEAAELRATRPAPLEPLSLRDRHGLAMWCTPLPGHVTGALMFRVGHGDETLVQRGLTHLTEHLALSGIRDPALQWNGFVDLNRTVFHATGPQANVEAFLATVARRLRDVDVETLERERAVLSAEARGAPPSIVGDMFSRRYGANGWGTSAWWEMGIPKVVPEQIRDWQQRWFTRENAVMWMTAMPTQTLRVDLPTGTRRLPMTPAPITSGSGWIRHPSAVVGALARGPRSYASSAAVGGIVSELHRELRERGLCYSVQGAWHRLTENDGALTIVADMVAQRESEHLRAFLETIDRLATSFPQSLLDERLTSLSTTTEDGDVRARLDQWALNSLLGARPSDAARDRAEELAVSVEDATLACRTLRDDLLLALPNGVSPPDDRMRPLDEPRAPQVDGPERRFRVFYNRDDVRGRLVVGATGATVDDGHHSTTVHWGQVAAVMRWSDGTRLAIDTAGAGVLVEPTRYEDGLDVAAAIDSATPPDLHVVVGDRYAAPVLNWAPPRSLQVLKFVRTATATVLALATLLLGVVALSRPPVVFAVASTAAAFVAFAVLTTRRPRPFVWDNGNTRTNVPESYDRSTWYIPGGLLLGWAIDHDELSTSWRDHHVAEIDAYLAGRQTAPVLYRSTGGILADDVLSDIGNEFFTDYIAQSGRGFNRDLAAAFPAHDYFSIPDTVDSQRIVSATIQQAFERWRSLGGSSVLRSLRRIAWHWGGPQSDEWAASVVQWWRHRAGWARRRVRQD